MLPTRHIRIFKPSTNLPKSLWIIRIKMSRFAFIKQRIIASEIVKIAKIFVQGKKHMSDPSKIVKKFLRLSIRFRGSPRYLPIGGYYFHVPSKRIFMVGFATLNGKYAKIKGCSYRRVTRDISKFASLI